MKMPVHLPPRFCQSIAKFIVCMLLCLCSTNLMAQIQSIDDGDWSNPATWDCNCIPGTTDDVQVNALDTVAVTDARDCDDLTVVSGATLNVSGSLAIAGAATFSGVVNNTGTITGAGTKTFASGAILNNNNGTLGGGEHVIASGATVNVNGAGFASCTVRNYGTFNWESGHINETGPFSCYYSSPPPAIFINEEDGVVNLNATGSYQLGYTWVTNHGQITKNMSSVLTFTNACAGSIFTNETTGTLDVLAGEIIFTSGTTTFGGTVVVEDTITQYTPGVISGDMTIDGVYNNYGPTTIGMDASFDGTGRINNHSSLNNNADFEYSIPILNMSGGNIGGSGMKTYVSGVTIDITSGGLYGGEHNIADGATLIVNAGGFGGGTTIRNHGIFNWQSGDINPTGPFSCFYGAGPPAVFINEIDGEWNINTPASVKLGYTSVTNHGLIKKTTTSTLDFTSEGGCAPSSFTNSSSGIVGGIGAVLFTSFYAFIAGGTVAPGTSPGLLTFNNNVDFGGTEYICEIQGTAPGTEYDQLHTSGQAVLTQMSLEVDWSTFIPAGGDAFVICTFGSKVGEFASVSIPSIPDREFSLVYNETDVTLNVIEIETPDCFDGIKNGDELGIDCGGSCAPCSPPDAVCGVITVYVDPNNPVYDGFGSNNIWWIPAEDLDAGSSSDAPSPYLNVRRHLSNITFDWTIAGACMDATPNGGALSNADKGIVYRTCLPVRNADFNVNRIYQLQISDPFGTDVCYGTVKVKTATPTLSAPSIHYVIPAAEEEMIVDYYMQSVDQDFQPDVLSYTGVSDFIVYPNPGGDLLQMSWDAQEDEQTNVLVTDMAGHHIFSNDYDVLKGQNTVMIDMSSHPSGLFMVHVKSGTMQEMRKWMRID